MELAAANKCDLLYVAWETEYSSSILLGVFLFVCLLICFLVFSFVSLHCLSMSFFFSLFYFISCL